MHNFCESSRAACEDRALGFFMNFPSATISAAEFPLVYPEVNNLWRDKSVCGGELDSQTVEGGWLAGWLGTPPPTLPHPPTATTIRPSTPPRPSFAPSPCAVLVRYLLGRPLEVQICVPTCSRRLSACFPLVSADQVCGPVSPVCRRRNRIIDRPVTPPNHIMESY